MAGWDRNVVAPSIHQKEPDTPKPSTSNAVVSECNDSEETCSSGEINPHSFPRSLQQEVQRSTKKIRCKTGLSTRNAA